MADNMKVALLISVIFSGLGLAYLGDVKKGLTYFGITIVLNVLGMWVSSIFSFISILVWLYALYLTYIEAQLVN
ncbi:MAG: hypothetical protein IJL02_11335 [Methanobrevibacter sp.]|uniref:hypothetical protein n=1 Tax=Methanobrevibacter sp. TaxID=66852 RepID=UPI0025D22AF1|nr:hypothetical protein [Methanobrevibacter sp.]MBQ6100438.1 hypothetical protein [Methanobrevibacter sp.]